MARKEKPCWAFQTISWRFLWPSKTDLVEHEIHLKCDKPVQAAYRRVPLQAECIKELEDLIEAGILEHSDCTYNNPVSIFKRNDKTRVLFDPREPNSRRAKSFCTVPALNTTAGCHGAKYFPSMDGFLTIPPKREHRHYTFAIPGVGRL